MIKTRRKVISALLMLAVLTVLAVLAVLTTTALALADDENGLVSDLNDDDQGVHGTATGDLENQVASETSTEAPSPYLTPIANGSTKEEMISFLDEAKDYVLKNGKDEGLEAFGDPAGEFVRGDLYAFAYDFNGKLLAHPHRPELVGKNNLDLVDPNGVHVIRNLMEVAKRGRGFIYSVYPNPAHGNVEELKLGYVTKVDGDLWIGSGIYLKALPPRFSPQDREALRAFVDEARNYSVENGRESAIDAFNDPAERFVREDLYIFAYDFNGTTLALPFQPEVVGENRIDVEDANGVTFVQDFLSLARGGGGESYYLYPNPAENMTEELKLSYVTKVDDTWWLGAGIYEP